MTPLHQPHHLLVEAVKPTSLCLFTLIASFDKEYHSGESLASGGECRSRSKNEIL